MTDAFDPFDWEYSGPWEFSSESDASQVAQEFLRSEEVITDFQYVSSGDYEARPAEGYTIDDVLERFEAIAGGDQPFVINFSRIGRDDDPKIVFWYEVEERFIEE